MSFILSNKSEIRYIKSIYDVIAKYVSKRTHNKEGSKVLKVRYYTRYGKERKREIIILSRLAKKFPKAMFVGIDLAIPKNFEKKYENLKLYTYFLESDYRIFKERLECFDLIYFVNVPHLIENLSMHLDIIHNLLKNNRVFVVGWNLFGILKSENIPKHKNQEIINIIHRYFRILHFAVYIYHKWNHYHIFLLLVLKK